MHNDIETEKKRSQLTSIQNNVSFVDQKATGSGNNEPPPPSKKNPFKTSSNTFFGGGNRGMLN